MANITEIKLSSNNYKIELIIYYSPSHFMKNTIARCVKKSLLPLLTSLSLMMGIVPSVSAQQNGDILEETMTDMYIVGGSGLGGAILGLSTLSFVDEPSEHLDNIVVGGAIGIIIGVGVVAWRQANKSAQYYDATGALQLKKDYAPASEFTTVMRSGWHRNSHHEISSELARVGAAGQSAFNLQFDF